MATMYIVNGYNVHRYNVELRTCPRQGPVPHVYTWAIAVRAIENWDPQATFVTTTPLSASTTLVERVVVIDVLTLVILEICLNKFLPIRVGIGSFNLV